MSSNNHDMTKFSRESTWQLLSLADRVDKCNEMLDNSKTMQENPFIRVQNVICKFYKTKNFSTKKLSHKTISLG